MSNKQLPNFNHKQVEAKWQKFWRENETFKFDENGSKLKYYALSMFPYPSGELHVGHLRNFAIGDVVARYKRLQGYNVLHPIGADAFGLPAENAAIKRGRHPSDWTHENLDRFLDRMEKAGLSFDWSRVVATCDPEYYGCQQKIFLDFYKKGLAYQKESFVNWDPVDQTVLANEQVVDGRGWRSDSLVEKKKLNQWFFKITKYAEELLVGLKDLKGWPEQVKTMQENWIGKSEGALVDFDLVGSDDKISVYTTRPDTLFGASFVGISLNHPIAEKLALENPEIDKFLKECAQTAVDEETLETMEKKGVKTNLKVKHPFDDSWELPVYIANFILMEYGTGAIFACPAHDERDFEFATKYKLPIIPVVSSDGSECETVEEAYTELGIAINSKFLNGLKTGEAKSKAIEELVKTGKGEKKVNYRLRDWGLSRQRYWGCPIPIIHCPHCGIVPVSEKELPLKLPKDVVFDGKGNPLENHPTWKHVDCPLCGAKAQRETDTMDTFVDSAWYFMRYVELSDKAPINKELCNKILPVDQYVGGIEHATMHLIYFRFFTKAMRDCGYLDINEPVVNLFNQGLVLHEAFKDRNKNWVYPYEVKKQGEKYYHVETNEELQSVGVIKMSKSKSNVVDVTNLVETYGADAGRMFVLSDSPADKSFEWTDTGAEGCWKFMNRFWKLGLSFVEDNDVKKLGEIKLDESNKLLKQAHKTIKGVTEDFDILGFNCAIAKIRELFNAVEKYEAKNENEKAVQLFAIKIIVKLIAPFTPFISEELWEMLGEKVKLHEADWPKYNEKMLVDDVITVVVQINGKVKVKLEVAKDMPREELEKLILSNQDTIRYIDGREIKKVIIVPNKLVNLVI